MIHLFDKSEIETQEEPIPNYRLFLSRKQIKHARLAMLAAAGWPLSELWDRSLADSMGMQALIDSNNRAPSVLNGGLGKVSPLYWALILVLASAIDIYGLKIVNDKDYTPGDLGFDPLRMHGKKNPKWRAWMETAEIKNGRLAMLGITGFAFQEAFTSNSVVDQNPVFFEPLWDFVVS